MAAAPREGPTIDGYVQDLIGTVGGPAARDMRIHVLRIPDFNAVMSPTGFAVVFSGLLLRMRDEAQLAGVIAHESASGTGNGELHSKASNGSRTGLSTGLRSTI